MHHSNTLPRSLLVAAALIGGILHSLQFHRLLEGRDGLIGDDYSAFVPMLLDGVLFFRAQGLAIPWYSPARCGGVPFFADPQSMYYSLPQFAAFFLSPLVAVQITLIALSIAGAAFMYLIIRRIFNCPEWASLIGASMFLANGFYKSRMVSGQLSYHSFALIPAAAWLLLEKSVPAGVSAALLSLLIGYFVYSGFFWGPFLVPASIGLIVLTAYSFGVTLPSASSFLIRLLSGAFGGLLISLPRLLISMSLLNQFPRPASFDQVSSLWEGILLVLSQLFLYGAFQPFRWSVHEYDCTIPLVALAGIALFPMAVSRGRAVHIRPLCALAAAAALCFLFGTGLWGFSDYFKSMPVVSSARVNMRLNASFIFPLVLVSSTGFAAVRTRHRQIMILVAAIILSLLPGERLRRTASHYSGFQSRDVDDYYQRIRKSPMKDIIPNRIGRPFLSVPPGTETTGFSGAPRRDDFEQMLRRVSNPTCYFPLFTTHTPDLVEGDVWLIRGGRLNFANPACYVFPEENACKPGDRIRVSEGDKLNLLLNYRNAGWEVPFIVRTSFRIAAAALVVSICILFFGALRSFPGIQSHSNKVNKLS